MNDRSDKIPTAEQSVAWLKEQPHLLHKDVTQNLGQAKLAQKAEFDPRNRVVTPDWKVGDKVWLQLGSPRARGDVVITLLKRFREKS